MKVQQTKIDEEIGSRLCITITHVYIYNIGTAGKLC